MVKDRWDEARVKRWTKRGKVPGRSYLHAEGEKFSVAIAKGAEGNMKRRCQRVKLEPNSKRSHDKSTGKKREREANMQNLVCFIFCKLQRIMKLRLLKQRIWFFSIQLRQMHKFLLFYFQNRLRFEKTNIIIIYFTGLFGRKL